MYQFTSPTCCNNINNNIWVSVRLYVCLFLIFFVMAKYSKRDFNTILANITNIYVTVKNIYLKRPEFSTLNRYWKSAQIARKYTRFGKYNIISFDIVMHFSLLFSSISFSMSTNSWSSGLPRHGHLKNYKIIRRD